MALHRGRGVARGLLDLLLPPQCLTCDGPVAEPGRLCAACFHRVDLIGDPLCARCGLPFEFRTEPGQICAACLRDPPAFDHARAVARYDTPVREAILGFKHGDRTERAIGFARLMLRAGRPWLDRADMVAAVPLHPSRLRRRRFNQAGLLAQELAVLTDRPAIPDLLCRVRPTRSQGGLSGPARRRNVRGAFAITARHRHLVQGAHVVLTDDVYTTGATIDACARVLKRAGAAEVTVLAIARVVRVGETPYSHMSEMP